jgi:hypothetical protein
MPEQRTFQTHPNLLLDVITRQAGTLDKAILEGAMNLIEARATKGEITLGTERLTIADDGKGFETRDEIIAAFETFGKSDERKAEEKTWARFQMGRGQLFAFGKTTYRTRTFEMIVDIRASGLSYELHEDLPDQLGCTVTVELYEPLTTWEIARVARDVERNLLYAITPITFNGVQITRDPAKEKWTEETDAAYIRQTSGTRLAIYNLGVFVEETYVEGAGGVVVSKVQLDVNFARNQVLRNSPTWRSIAKHFKSRTERDLLKKSTFTADDVATLLARMEEGMYRSWQLARLPIFRDTNNRRRSAEYLAKLPYFTLDAKGSTKADVLMQRDGTVCVLDRDFCEEVVDGTNVENGVVALLRRILPDRKAVPSYIAAETLYEGMDERRSLLPEAKLSKEVRLARNVLASRQGHALYSGLRELGYEELPHTRPLHIGLTTGAELAWTNGVSYIAFEQSYFAENIKTLRGWVSILSTLSHEYAHSGDERTHDADFYERYHDMVDSFVQSAAPCFVEFSKRYAKASKKGLAQLRAVSGIEQFDTSIREIGDSDGEVMIAAAS